MNMAEFLHENPETESFTAPDNPGINSFAEPESEETIDQLKATSEDRDKEQESSPFLEHMTQIRERLKEGWLTYEASKTLDQVPSLYQDIYSEAQRCLIQLRAIGAPSDIISNAEDISKTVQRKLISFSLLTLFDSFKDGLRKPATNNEEYIAIEFERRANIAKRTEAARKVSAQISSKVQALNDRAQGTAKRITEVAAHNIQARVSNVFYMEQKNIDAQNIDEESTDDIDNGQEDRSWDEVDYQFKPELKPGIAQELSPLSEETSIPSTPEERSTELSVQPELLEEVDGQTNKIRETIGESYLRIDLLGALVRELPRVCEELSTWNKNVVEQLKQARASDGTTPGVELIGNMINAIPREVDTATLSSELKQALNTPTPDIQEVDYDHLASLGQDEANKYLETVKESNNKTVRLVIDRRNRLIGQVEEALSKLTTVGQNIHFAAEHATDSAKGIIETYSHDYDTVLADFHVRLIDIQPGHIYDKDIANHSHVVRVMYTHDKSLDNTVASVHGASYSFNPELGLQNDPYGDSLGEATIEVYKYQE